MEVHLERGPLFLGSVVSIGAFDGVHKGHQKVISHAVSRAKGLGVPSLVYTFDPPPRCFFQKAQMLTTVEEKLARFEALRVDHVVVAKFDEFYINRTSESFIEELGEYNPLEIHVGRDFRFGKKRAGDLNLLARHFKVEPTNTVRCSNGDVISSTRIRNHLSQGKVQEALTLLGWSYSNRSRKQLVSNTSTA
ncbi:FAD synthetase family protein [Alkalihalobacillus sp. CinArs1]|uniref:FAD synthetase family protein n=1 Tax=Alkalihalobacillus sp. CinArs1 TaxID=2995314 RepID=UPI0022DE13CE|nr:FAD synthetase family protein [Alkalihalobacillus sp. CinArs1]